MTIRKLAPWFVCAAILVPPAAFGEPRGDQRAKPIRFGTNLIQVRGTYGCDGVIPFCAFFSAESFDDTDGIRQGTVWVSYTTTTSQFGQNMQCSGPAYADAFNYDEKTFKFSINVTLDAYKDPSCSHAFADVVVINISGEPNGNYQDSSTGRGVITTDSSKTKYKVEHDVFWAVATGSNGFYHGTYSANFESTRRTERTKVTDKGAADNEPPDTRDGH